MKAIYEFGESDNNQWYLLDGERVECDEDTAQHLAIQWINHRHPNRRVEGDYTIYSVFKNPLWV